MKYENSNKINIIVRYKNFWICWKWHVVVQKSQRFFASLGFLCLCLLFVVSCGAPEKLKGEWLAQTRKCRLKDKSGNFRENFGDTKNPHTLIFKENNKVQLFYPKLKVTVTGTEDQKSQTEYCDIVITGTYSLSLFGGSLEFDFAHEETGTWDISKGTNCALNQGVPTKMPENSPYAKDPSVSLIKVSPSELHLGFPGHNKCKNEKMIFIFLKNR